MGISRATMPHPCALRRAFGAFTLNPVWRAHAGFACSERAAFVIECRAEKEITELRSCS
jgi:hypothetical protein